MTKQIYKPKLLYQINLLKQFPHCLMQYRRTCEWPRHSNALLAIKTDVQVKESVRASFKKFFVAIFMEEYYLVLRNLLINAFGK